MNGICGMELPTLDTTEKIFAVIASIVAIAAAVISLFKKRDTGQPVENMADLPSSRVDISGVNIQSGNKSRVVVSGPIVNNVNNVNTNSRQVPEQLAKPDFVLRQTGCSLSASEPSQYTFEVTNFGGNCFNVVFIEEHDAEQRRFPQFNRGQSKSIKLTFTRTPSHIHIVIKGSDSNGEQFTQNKFAVRETQGFVFRE